MNDDQMLTAPSDPAEDLLTGAGEIAAFLGWKERKVYSAREACRDGPIRKQPGIGIFALRSELRAWLRSPSAAPHDSNRSAA